MQGERYQFAQVGQDRARVSNQAFNGECWRVSDDAGQRPIASGALHHGRN
jgi:hypothetical protein